MGVTPNRTGLHFGVTSYKLHNKKFITDKYSFISSLLWPKVNTYTTSLSFFLLSINRWISCFFKLDIVIMARLYIFVMIHILLWKEKLCFNENLSLSVSCNIKYKSFCLSEYGLYNSNRKGILYKGFVFLFKKGRHQRRLLYASLRSLFLFSVSVQYCTLLRDGINDNSKR